MKSEYLSTDFCLDSSICSDCWKVSDDLKVSGHWEFSDLWEFSEHKNAKGEHTNYQNQGHNKAQPKTTLPAVWQARKQSVRWLISAQNLRGFRPTATFPICARAFPNRSLSATSVRPFLSSDRVALCAASAPKWCGISSS